MPRQLNDDDFPPLLQAVPSSAGLSRASPEALIQAGMLLLGTARAQPQGGSTAAGCRQSFLCGASVGATFPGHGAWHPAGTLQLQGVRFSSQESEGTRDLQRGQGLQGQPCSEGLQGARTGATQPLGVPSAKGKQQLKSTEEEQGSLPPGPTPTPS